MTEQVPTFIDDPDLGAQLRRTNSDRLLLPAAAKMLADAIEIADSTARSDIERHFLRDDDGWYNTDVTGDEKDFPWLPQILRYLTARGLIERMTGDNLGADLVRFVKRA